MGTETILKSEAVGADSLTDLENRIIRQIEYYFGNYNLSRDKFLREQLKLDDGWVPLETMVKFNRLKKLSEDFNVIIEALKKSPRQLMEVSDDCKKIRRRSASPLPADYKERQNELDEKTLYVKGFKRENTLDELLDFFREYNVEHIYMRRIMRQNNKPFKGSVFVTFEEKADAESFLNSKGIKYKGTELLKEWKKDYLKRKDESYKTLKEEKERKKLSKAGLLKEKEDDNDQKVAEIEIIPGCLLKLTNLDENTTREDIKEVFDPFGTLVYVDYSKGKPSAVIRFESGIANSVLEKINEEGGIKKIEIGSCEAEVSAIEGEEEKEYWRSIAKSRAQNRLKFNKGNHKNFGNKGRFKNWGKRRRGKEEKEDKDESVEPAEKKVKSEGKEENSAADSKDSLKVKGESDEPPTKKVKSEVKEDKSNGFSTEASEIKKEIPEVKSES